MSSSLGRAHTMFRTSACSGKRLGNTFGAQSTHRAWSVWTRVPAAVLSAPIASQWDPEGWRDGPDAKGKRRARKATVRVVFNPWLSLLPIPYAAHILCRFSSCRMLIIPHLSLLTSCVQPLFFVFYHALVFRHCRKRSRQTFVERGIADRIREIMSIMRLNAVR